MRTVLIVDDEMLARRMLKESIVWEEYGYTVVKEAQNGKEGLEWALSHKPDLIFVDIKMPLMDGLELVKQFQAAGLRSKIVMLTCYEDFAYVREAMRYGAVDYLLKHTFEQEDLIALLRKVEKLIKKENAQLESIDLLKADVLDKIVHANLTMQDIRGYVEAGVLPSITPRYMVIYMKIQRPVNEKERQCFEQNIRDSFQKSGKMEKILDVLLSRASENEIYMILICDENCGVSSVKAEIGEARSVFLQSMQDWELGWIAGITYHMFCDWRDLAEAFQEAKDAARVIGEFLQCSPKVIRAVEYIRSHYSRQISLEDIAEYVGVSRVYLSQLFKKETGKNISDYLVEYRMSQAKELLLTSNLKIGKISQLCGFGSAQYFNKIFKKITGFSPYQFKDNKIQ